MAKRDQDFLRAIDTHVRTYSTLPPEDTEALLALAWRGARGSENKKLKAEIERLRVENIQMRFALGYPMPADLERHVLPSNPFQCGVCDARRKAAMDAIIEADRELI